MIIHGGANIWPRELEEVLSRHPDVADVAVVGIHDDRFGENACACVVPRPGAGLTLEHVIAFMTNEVAKYKLPQHLELFGSLPLGPTGKVLKRELRRAGRETPHGGGHAHRGTAMTTGASTRPRVVTAGGFEWT